MTRPPSPNSFLKCSTAKQQHQQQQQRSTVQFSRRSQQRTTRISLVLSVYVRRSRPHKETRRTPRRTPAGWRGGKTWAQTKAVRGLVENDTAVDVLRTFKSSTLIERETQSEGKKKRAIKRVKMENRKPFSQSSKRKIKQKKKRHRGTGILDRLT